MGFNDKETKMLMAITTSKKSQIIAKHPDLDMDNITLEDPKGRVTLNIKGPTGKTIVTFGVKEGEKRAEVAQCHLLVSIQKTTTST